MISLHFIYKYFACVNFCPFSSSWSAAACACDCGAPWTFLFIWVVRGGVSNCKFQPFYVVLKINKHKIKQGDFDADIKFEVGLNYKVPRLDSDNHALIPAQVQSEV